jgi:hypothetical protein
MPATAIESLSHSSNHANRKSASDSPAHPQENLREEFFARSVRSASVQDRGVTASINRLPPINEL